MEASTSASAHLQPIERMLLHYIWPPVLTADLPSSINVCFGALRTEVGLRLQDADTVLLDARAQILQTGCTTVKLDLMARASCTTLLLTAQELATGPQDTLRGPSSVPLLVLPLRAASEICNLFDQFVKLELQQLAPIEPGPQASAAQASAIEQQNLLVGRVYRTQILPLLQDIYGVLHGVQDLVLWIRLSAMLRQCGMQQCLEVLRGHMKANASQAGPAAHGSHRQNPLISSNSDVSLPTASGANPLPTRSSNNTKSSVSSGNTNSNQSNVQQSSGRAGSTSSRTSSSIYHSLPIMGSSPLDTSIWETNTMMQSMDESRIWQPDQEDTSEPGSGSVGARDPRTAPIEHHPLSGLMDTDDELLMLSTLYQHESLQPGSGHTDVMLTTYVPVQQEHMHDYPAYTLIDPENPISQPVSSSSLGFISGVVHASQELSRQRNQPVIQLSEDGHSPAPSMPLTHISGHGTDRTSSWKQDRSPMGSSCSEGLVATTPLAQISTPSGPIVSGIRHRLIGAAAAPGEAVTSSHGSAWPSPSTSRSLVQVLPSFQAALQGCIGGFSSKHLEKQFTAYWSKTMWFPDTITLGLTLLLMVCSLQSSVIVGASGHNRGSILVVTGFLGGPLLVGTYMLVVHRKATVKHREAITAVSRLIHACWWIVALGLKLHYEVGFLQLMMVSAPVRLAVAQAMNAFRPLLLRSAVLCCMMESFCLASLAEHTAIRAWLLEMLLLWCSMLVVAAVIDSWRRYAFLLYAQRHPSGGLLIHSSSSDASS